MKNLLYYFKIVLPSIVILLFGQISSKYGMSLNNTSNTFVGIPTFLFFLAFGYLCLFVRGFVWINILKKIDLSIAYPLTSISIVVVMIFSHLIFNEEITTKKIVGSALIIVGGIVVTYKKND